MEEELRGAAADASGAGASVGGADGTEAGCAGEIGRGNKNELAIDETEAGRTGSGTRGGEGRLRRIMIGDNCGEDGRPTAAWFGADGDL